MATAKRVKATTGNTNPVDMPAFFKNIPIAYPPGIPTTAVISNAIKVVKRPSIINACFNCLFVIPIDFSVPISCFCDKRFVTVRLI